jgi:hypothetical protein
LLAGLCLWNDSSGVVFCIMVYPFLRLLLMPLSSKRCCL